MVTSSRFHSTADRPDPGMKATGDRGPGRVVSASAGATTPATAAAMATRTAMVTRTSLFPVLRTPAAPLDWDLLAASATGRPGPRPPGLPTITGSTRRVFKERTQQRPGN